MRQKKSNISNEKKLEALNKKINELPSSCSKCQKKFNPKSDADSWMVHALPGLAIQLICPTCWKIK